MYGGGGGGGAPASDNPFGDASAGAPNPYMAQQAQQMGGFGGYNQFGQMQADPSNPYAAYGGMGMQQPGMMGYGGGQSITIPTR